MNLKDLKNTEKTVSNELDKLKQDASKVNKDIVLKKRELRQVQKDIAKYKNKEVTITDHALLRYLERVKAVNIDEVRKEILSDVNIIKAIETLENGDFPTKYGILRVIDKTIVTILN